MSAREEYDQAIDEVFDKLEKIDAPREEYEAALARLHYRVTERCEEEEVDPDDFDPEDG